MSSVDLTGALPTSAAPPPSPSLDPHGGALIAARGVTRRYPGVVALDDVSIAIHPGSVHVIAGENGAGKSTLVKVLTGVERADAGTVTISGRNAQAEPALFKRIGYVPQELNLFAHLSVAENLFLPFDQGGRAGIMLDRKRLSAAAEKMLDRFGIKARPNQQAGDLSVADQQLLMIARACTRDDLDVLILDEPTSSLTQTEVERLFAIIGELRSQGRGIVFISHKSEEVLKLGDEVTVLRNGANVGHMRMADTDERQLLSLMAGREVSIDETFRPEVAEGEVILQVRGLSGDRFANVDFELRRGEILGFAGLIGSGRTELMQTIFGYRKATAGSVRILGQEHRLGHPDASVKAGLLYLSEERKAHGIFPKQSVLHNIGAALMDKTVRFGLVSSRAENALAADIIREFDVKTPSLGQRIVNLSGGNQQKAIIGRAMATKPKVLILDEPTRGIDVRTKIEIYRIMKTLAEEGVGVIVISSEILELRKCATRIVCLYAGTKQAEFRQAEFNNENIVSAIFGRWST